MTSAARTRTSPDVRAVAALLTATLIWGTTFVMIQEGIKDVPPAPFLAWRFALAAAVMLAFRPRCIAELPPIQRKRGLLIGAAVAIGYFGQTIGLQYTSAAVSGFITGMFVVFTPLVAAIWMNQPVGRLAWFAVALATVGLALLSLKGFAIGYGEALTLMAALMFAIQIVGLGTWSTAEDAYGLTVVQLLMVAVAGLALTPFSPGPYVPTKASTWAILLFLALAATAGAFWLQTWAQSRLMPTQAAVILTMEPVFAGLTAALVGQPITWRIIAGGALVLIAMYLVELGPRRGKDASLPHLEP